MLKAGLLLKGTRKPRNKDKESSKRTDAVWNTSFDDMAALRCCFVDRPGLIDLHADE
jgi:hypothetical protein